MWRIFVCHQWFSNKVRFEVQIPSAAQRSFCLQEKLNMGLNVVTPSNQVTKYHDFGSEPVCLGSVSALASKGGGGGGGKSALLSPIHSAADVSSPPAVAPTNVEELLIVTLASAGDRAASSVVEGAGGSGLGRGSSRWPVAVLSWLWSLPLGAGGAGGARGVESARGTLSLSLSSKSKASPSSSSTATPSANTRNTVVDSATDSATFTMRWANF